MRTSAHVSRVVSAFPLLVLLMSGGAPGFSAPPPKIAERGAASAALAVSVRETPDSVLLRIQASGDVEPESVEVELADRKAVVLARDAEGRPIRSRPLRLPEVVVEHGATAAYDDEGALVMTFRKQATVRDAGPVGGPEATVR
jgi:hypothetical protein